MKKNILFLSLIIVCIFLVTASIQAQAPQLLNYQGKLIKDGIPASGTYSIVFSIYADSTGSTPLWDVTRDVAVKNGVFNILLGSVRPFTGTIFTNSGERFLGIKVGTDPEMKPRFQLTSVPFAIQAMNIPSGVIVLWSGAVDNIPVGWALCDGKKYLRFDGKGEIETPNLSGMFVVGAGIGYGVGDSGGSDSVALSINQLPGHNHGKGTLTTNSSSHNHQVEDFHSLPNNYWGSSGGMQESAPSDYSTRTTTNNHHSHSISGNTDYVGSGHSHENRPPYYALAYIIKL
jgi:microcystin-dependent protein